MMNYVIFDIATLRYRYGANHATLSALAPTGELLAVVDLAPHHSAREAAFLASDAALRGGLVLRGGVHVRVALYNPYTGQVCLSPVPNTQLYSDLEPLVFDIAGTTGVLSDDGETLQVSGRSLLRVTPTPSSVSRAILAHQN